MAINDGTNRADERVKADARHWLSLLKDYAQLEAVDKLTVLSTLCASLFVLFILLFAGVCCLGISLSHVLAAYLGSVAGGYALAGVFFILVGLLFWALRKSLLENFFMRMMARLVTNAFAKSQVKDNTAVSQSASNHSVTKI